MKTIEKIFLFENNNITIKTLFSKNKIWLTKKEISNIYWVKKSEIKKELNSILLNSNLDITENIQKIYNKTKEKKEIFYSLDILVLLWYNSKHFKETKFLVNANTILKKYTISRKYRSPIFSKKPLIKNIVHFLTPKLKIA